MKDGLPSGRVPSIAQTPDGYLWLLTTGGLVRFDGVRFSPSPELQEALQTEIVLARAMVVGRDGALWIAGRSFICRLKNGLFTVYRTTFDALFLAEGANGRMWIGLDSAGLLSLENGRFTSYPQVNVHVRALYEDGRGKVWLGGLGDVIGCLSGNDWRTYTTRDGLRDTNIHAIARDGSGNIWVASRNGLTLFRDGRFVASPATGRLASTDVTAIREAAGGGLWVGTSAGAAYRLSQGRLESLPSADSETDSSILSICEDREGSLWIGTADGLMRLRRRKFTVYTTEQGLAHNRATAIIESRDGTIWVFSDGGGISTIKGGRVGRITARDGLASDFGGPLFEGRDGGVWVGTANGLSRIKGGKVTSYSRGALARRYVSAMFEDEEGLVIALASSGLFRFRDGELTPFAGANVASLRTPYVYEALCARNGPVWLATGAGLVRILRHQVRVFTQKDGLLEDNVSSAYEDQAGVLWLATSKVGIARLSDGKLLTLTTKQGLYDDRVYRVLDDSSGNLWMSCPRGLFRVTRQDIEDYASGKIQRVRSVVYGVADGMKSSECSVGAQAPGWKSRDGRLWFPTVHGVVSFDPDHLPLNALPPPVVIEKLVVDDQSLRPQGPIELGPGKQRLEFHFTALSLLAPDKVQFRYRLDDFDQDWVKVGNRRVAYYARIPPGRYRFRVIASNNDGVWNDTGATLGLRLTPHFHQTRLFFWMVVAVAALAIWGVHHLRVFEMRRRYDAVLDERQRIAREMHDTLAQNLGGVALQLDAVRMHSADIPAGVLRSLDETSTMIRYSLAEAYRAIRDLRTEALESRDLKATLTEIARRVTADTGVEFRLRVAGSPQHLSAIAEHTLVRIGQEAIVNVVKHARATRIDLEMLFARTSLTLRIRDDGCGFEPTQAFLLSAGHYGLLGMRERIERIGGRLTLQSGVGAGTEIAVEVPFDS